MWNFLSYILISMLMFFAVYRFTRLFFDTRKSSNIFFVISHFSYVLVLLWNWDLIFSNFPPEISFENPNVGTLYYGVIQFLKFTLPTFLITLNYESSKIKRLAVANFSTILLEIFIGFSSNIFMIFFPVWGGAWISFFSVNLLHSLLWFHILLTIIQRFTDKKAAVLVPHAFWYLVLFFSLSTFLSFMLGNLFAHSLNMLFLGWMIVALIGGILLFVLYNLLGKSQKNAIKAATYELERENYRVQLQLMQQSAERTKAIRHDMKLHLSAIAGYTAENQAATEYINNLLGEICKQEIYSESGNIAFDSVINFKLNTAEISEFNPQIRLLIPPTISMEVADIVTILGNLLDNALTATAATAEKSLILDIELSRGALFIKVENSFCGEIKYSLGKNGDSRYIVSKKGGGNHGFGLKNVRRCVEKYDGELEILVDGGVFSVVVVVYVGEK
ncbi:MAG: GHKL domain-containing protein [Firmicutes bacterium]|nr:GHKL domain-containing protein [Bacillota bacterium]